MQVNKVVNGMKRRRFPVRFNPLRNLEWWITALNRWKTVGNGGRFRQDFRRFIVVSGRIRRHFRRSEWTSWVAAQILKTNRNPAAHSCDSSTNVKDIEDSIHRLYPTTTEPKRLMAEKVLTVLKILANKLGELLFLKLDWFFKNIYFFVMELII